MSDPIRQPNVSIEQYLQLAGYKHIVPLTKTAEEVKLVAPTTDLNELVSAMHESGCFRDEDFHTSYRANPSLCQDKEVKKRIAEGKTVMLTARRSGLSLCRRLNELMAVVDDCISVAPEDPDGQFDYTDIIKELQYGVAVKCGAQGALGRVLAHLPLHYEVVSKPATKNETELSFRQAGLLKTKKNDLPFTGTDLLQLGQVTGFDSVELNLKSGNGALYLGDCRDPEVLRFIISQAKNLRNAFGKCQARVVKTSNDTAVKLLKKEFAERFVLQGACKTDFYKWSKVEEGTLRFYNVVSRDLLLIMQQATQVVSREMRLFPESNTTIGYSLARGGAHELMKGLAEKLRIPALDLENGKVSETHVHHGDDSLMVMRTEAGLSFYGFDATSFDLTQNATATRVPREHMQKILQSLDIMSGQVWGELSGDREVLLAEAIVVLMRHGIPSGLPLVSQLNGVMMNIYLNRLRLRISINASGFASLSEEDIQEEGKSLGFAVRTEFVYHIGEQSIRAALLRVSIKFTGYYFYTDSKDDTIKVMADVPRLLAKLVYRNESMERLEGRELGALIAARLVGCVVSFGIPEEGWDGVRQVLIEAARARLSLLENSSGILAVNAALAENAIAGLEFVSIGSIEGMRHVLDEQRLSDIWLDRSFQPEQATAELVEHRLGAVAKGPRVPVRPGGGAISAATISLMARMGLRSEPLEVAIENASAEIAVAKTRDNVAARSNVHSGSASVDKGLAQAGRPPPLSQADLLKKQIREAKKALERLTKQESQGRGGGAGTSRERGREGRRNPGAASSASSLYDTPSEAASDVLDEIDEVGIQYEEEYDAYEDGNRVPYDADSNYF